jgi:hypothetical protein
MDRDISANRSFNKRDCSSVKESHWQSGILTESGHTLDAISIEYPRRRGQGPGPSWRLLQEIGQGAGKPCSKNLRKNRRGLPGPNGSGQEGQGITIASFKVQDGRSLAFQSPGTSRMQTEVWVMENFLPVDKARKQEAPSATKRGRSSSLLPLDEVVHLDFPDRLARTGFDPFLGDIGNPLAVGRGVDPILHDGIVGGQLGQTPAEGRN